MDLHDEIVKVAYELWEQSGRIEGRDLDNWLEAEKIVLTRQAGQTVEEPGPENVQKQATIRSSERKTKIKSKKSGQKK
jgi:hypothetical protein